MYLINPVRDRTRCSVAPQKDHNLRRIHRHIVRLLLTISIAVGLLGATFQPASAASYTLGGTPSEGNLEITVSDIFQAGTGSGQIGIRRYSGSSWVNQYYSQDAKGSRLQYDGGSYTVGYYATGTPATTESNTLSGNTVTTVWTAGDTRLTQVITYVDGQEYYRLDWTIENISSAPITDLRFFHGGDTYLLGGDNGSGFWDAANNTIGVEKPDGGGNLQRMSLQAITEPYAYESRYYSDVRASVNAGALTNAVDPNVATDNGYALEWRNASLPAGESWTITAYEKFVSTAIGAVTVSGPTAADCEVGTSCDLIFNVTNPTTAGVDVSLISTVDLGGWTATITSPTSPVTIPAASTESVTVQVTPPAGSAGDTAMVTLTANDGSADSSDTSAVTAIAPTYPTVVLGANTTPSNGAVLTASPAQITIEFNIDVLGDGSAAAANNTGNYMLFERGDNDTFDTVDCAGGILADDIPIAINSAIYDNNGGAGPFIATLQFNNGADLPDGTYRIHVCGTTSVETSAGAVLNDGLNDTAISFSVTGALPQTGFAPHQVTQPATQPSTMSPVGSGDMRLAIPSLGVDTRIVGVPQDWNITWLGDAVGWLPGTAFPTYEGNTALTGHVYTADGMPGPFVNLNRLSWGDTLTISADGLQYTYEVRANYLVRPDNMRPVEHKDLDWVTLITCQGYNQQANDYIYRRVVQAVLISID